MISWQGACYYTSCAGQEISTGPLLDSSPLRCPGGIRSSKRSIRCSTTSTTTSTLGLDSRRAHHHQQQEDRHHTPARRPAVTQAACTGRTPSPLFLYTALVPVLGTLLYQTPSFVPLQDKHSRRRTSCP